MDLPIKKSKKVSIKINNKDQKYFLWCYVRHINPSKEHPERIKKTDKKIAEKLYYDGLSLQCKKKNLARLK